MTQHAAPQAAYFDALPRRRSERREVLLPFRTTRDTVAQLSAAARAAGMTRQRWIEETLLAAIPPSLHDADTQKPLPAA